MLYYLKGNVVKICTKCNVEKELDEFYKDKSKKDGLSSSCKECKSTQNKSYTDSHKKEKSEYDAKRRAEKRDEINTKKREYYHTKGKEVEKIWRLANWGKVLNYAKNSKGKRRALERSYDLPASELIAWVDSQDKICTYCKCDCSEKYHIDHVVPLSKGGEHAISNFTIACPFCNISKGNKPLEEWQQLKNN